jgi:hypothetical protein
MSKFIDELTSIFHTTEHFVITLGKRELKVAATTPLGQAIKAAITAGEAGTTPVEKMTLALASFLPTLKTILADPSALETDLETAAKIILEDALAQVKTTGPLAIIEALAAAA